MPARLSGSVERVYGLIQGSVESPAFSYTEVVDTLRHACGGNAVERVEKITFTPSEHPDYMIEAASIGFRCATAARIGHTLWGQDADTVVGELLTDLPTQTHYDLLMTIDLHVALPWERALQERLPYLRDPPGSAWQQVLSLGGKPLAHHPLRCAVRHLQTAMLIYGNGAIRGNDPQVARFERLIELIVQRPIIGRAMANPGLVLMLS